MPFSSGKALFQWRFFYLSLSEFIIPHFVGFVKNFFQILDFFLWGCGSLSLSTLRVYYSKKFSKLQVVKMYKISGGQKVKFVQNFLLTKCVTRGIIEKSRGPGRPRATHGFLRGTFLQKVKQFYFCLTFVFLFSWINKYPNPAFRPLQRSFFQRTVLHYG